MLHRNVCLMLVFVWTGAAVQPVAVAEGESEWDRVLAGYGNIDHVAGIGADRQVNTWQSSFEGGSALAAELSNPHMAAADAFGNIFIADKESHSILRVSPTGTIHTAAGTHEGGYNGDSGSATNVQLNNPNGVFVLADGTFYIVDLDNQRIRRVDTNGQLTTVHHEPSGLVGGRALWVSPDEQTVLFAGFEPVGSTPSLKQWTAAGVSILASNFLAMGNITVDPNGRPVVTEDTANRVWRIAADGTREIIAGNGTTSGGGDGEPATSTGLNRVRGVAFLPNGGYFLATQKGSHIWYVDTAGIIHKMIDCASSGSINAGVGKPVTTPGVKMAEPRAITVAPNGDLLITASDYGHIRVVRSITPPSAPPISIVVTAGELRLRWTGVTWQSYLLEHAGALDSSNWSVLQAVTSPLGGVTGQALGELRATSSGFYRLRAPRW